MRAERSTYYSPIDNPFQIGREGLAPLQGFTLVEIMLVVCMIGVLTGLAVPAYTNHVDKVKSAEAMAVILEVGLTIEKFNAENGRYPNSLNEIGKAGLRDPWGREYQYLNMANDPHQNQCRKIGPVHPLNTDYDLYSAGKDGMSNKPINSAQSRDDIIRAYNGGYTGLARDLI